MASRAMAPAVHAAARARLHGVASREKERSRSLEPTKVFDSYSALVTSSEIDAVYISLTNSQHCHWVVEALNAGKNVLCEKPLALNANEVEIMLEASRRTGKAIVEAVWVRWHPRHQRFAGIVRSGGLGDEVGIRSAFTFVSEMTDNYRLQPEMGGGALLDVGCYQVHTWLAALGSDIDTKIIGTERVMGPTGVDLTTRASVALGESASAEMNCSFIEDSHQELVAVGSQASVSMFDGEAFTSWREASSLRVADTIETFAECDAFVTMIEQVSRQFAGEEPALFDAAESFRVARILDEIASGVQS